MVFFGPLLTTRDLIVFRLIVSQNRFRYRFDYNQNSKSLAVRRVTGTPAGRSTVCLSVWLSSCLSACLVYLSVSSSCLCAWLVHVCVPNSLSVCACASGSLSFSIHLRLCSSHRFALLPFSFSDDRALFGPSEAHLKVVRNSHRRLLYRCAEPDSRALPPLCVVPRCRLHFGVPLAFHSQLSARTLKPSPRISAAESGVGGGGVTVGAAGRPQWRS